jgi:hypothetical protein
MIVKTNERTTELEAKSGTTPATGYWFRGYLYLFLLGVVALSALAGSLEEGVDAARVALDNYHRRHTAIQFHEIYGEADELFRQSVTEDAFSQSIEAVQRIPGSAQAQTMWTGRDSGIGQRVEPADPVELAQRSAAEEFTGYTKGHRTLLAAGLTFHSRNLLS